MLVLPAAEIRDRKHSANSLDAGNWFYAQVWIEEAQLSQFKKQCGIPLDGRYEGCELAVVDSLNNFRRVMRAGVVRKKTSKRASRNEELLAPTVFEDERFMQNGKAYIHREYRHVFRLSQSLLLWPNHLADLGIAAEPGYLYLLMPHLPGGRLGPHDYSYLEPNLNEPEVERSWNADTHVLELSLPSFPRGYIRDLELLLNATEVETRQQQHSPPQVLVSYEFPDFRSEREAAGFLSRSKLLKRPQVHHERRKGEFYSGGYDAGEKFSVPEYPRVLKTPFEFPPGWVSETAAFLSGERGFRDTAFVKSFLEFALGEDTLQSAQSAVSLWKERQTESFPRGEARLSGADLAWRYSADPWFVQLVLFAHLIGGRYLTRVLSELALGFGKEKINWNSPLFKAEEVAH